MNTWEENKIMLSQIITSFLEESEITNKNSVHKIQNIFNAKLGQYYKKRFDYDMQELNKMFLEDIFNDINNLENNQPTQNVTTQQQQYNGTQPNISQPIQQPPQNIFEKSKETSLFDDISDSSHQNSTNISNNYKDKYVYTAEEIRAKKQLESQNMFDEKKREFEKYQNNFRPENIDFSDKPSGDNEKIDDVLKRVMETRQYDLQIPETEIKKAESWINNGREVETVKIEGKPNKTISQKDTNTKQNKNNEKPQNKKKEFIGMLKRKLNNKNKRNNNETKNQFDNKANIVLEVNEAINKNHQSEHSTFLNSITKNIEDNNISNINKNFVDIFKFMNELKNMISLLQKDINLIKQNIQNNSNQIID